MEISSKSSMPLKQSTEELQQSESREQTVLFWQLKRRLLPHFKINTQSRRSCKLTITSRWHLLVFKQMLEFLLTKLVLNAKALDSTWKMIHHLSTLLGLSQRHSRASLKKEESDHLVSQLSLLGSMESCLGCTKLNHLGLMLSGKQTQLEEIQRT